MKKQLSLLLALLTVAFTVTAFTPTNAWSRYFIRMNFMVDNPIMFPVGRIIPENMSNLDDIEFEDIKPFFQITCSGNDGGEDVYVHVRLTCDSEEIFNISSAQFPINTILGRTLNNSELARIPEISLGEASGESIANRIMQFINGNWLREGIYTIQGIISTHADYEQAMSDNLGMGSLSFYAQNTNQITLLRPGNEEQIATYPLFQWSFPRREGLVFTLRVIAGQDDIDPNEGFNSLDPDDIYAEIEIPVRHGMEGGDVTYYSYAGISPERPLEPNQTYFWQVEANVATMFEGETELIVSPAQSFVYSPAGTGDNPIGDLGVGPAEDGGDLLGGGGALAGGPLGGPQEDGGAPQENHPVFTMLRNYLPNEFFYALAEQLGDMSDYSPSTIRIGDNEVSLEQLGIYIATHDLTFVSMTISE